MIIKNLTRKSGTGQLIKYILRYVLDENKQIGTTKSNKPFVILHNIKSRNIEGFIKEFQENQKRRIYRRKDQTIVNHTILSWSTKDADKITDATLKAVAKEFIRLRGENNLYVFSKHTDRKHIHMHCALSGTQLNGRSNRITKAQFADLKIKLDYFQKRHFPDLINSLPNHGKGKELNIAPKQIWQNGKTLEKESASKVTQQALLNSKSIQEFLAALKLAEFEPYYRGKEKILTGVKASNDRKFRFKTLGFTSEQIASIDSTTRELKAVGAIRERSKTVERELKLENRKGLGAFPHKMHFGRERQIF